MRRRINVADNRDSWSRHRTIGQCLGHRLVSRFHQRRVKSTRHGQLDSPASSSLGQLNHPEAVALICDELLEEARAGKSYEEVMDVGSRVLSKNDVMEGVPELIRPIKVEAGFESGTKLIVSADPIQ